MSAIGIIANPASGKDIRRLVAYGSVFDNEEKINIVRRVLVGLATCGVDQVIYMPDYYGIVARAVEGLHHTCSNVEFTMADIKLTGTQIDSYHAALAMKDYGVGCIITLGGDGTNRMVAKACGEVPLLPISTGTNNVFPFMLEGTIAGLAAGLVASGALKENQGVYRTKKLEIYKKNRLVDIALIDAVVFDERFVASRAIWNMDCVKQVVVTRGEAHNIGIAAIAGNLIPIKSTEKKGLTFELQNDKINMVASIAPGRIVPFGIKNYKTVELYEKVKIFAKRGVIALDGEREIEILDNDAISIRLTFDGPNVVDAMTVLREAAYIGYFSNEKILANVVNCLR